MAITISLSLASTSHFFTDMSIIVSQGILIKAPTLTVISNSSTQELAIEKILKYIDNSNMIPILQNYMDAGITNVISANLKNINQADKDTSVDTLVEIKALVNGTINVDSIAPILTLKGDSNLTIIKDNTYLELGATAQDAVAENIFVNITGRVDTSNIGNHIITYSSTDSTGNDANITRSITIIEKSPATTMYYFDATNGDDSNDGLSEKTALKNLNKMNNISFQKGDTILLKRNSIFHETITINEDKNLTIGAYGAGAKPIISNIKEITNSWIKFSNNIWKSSIINFHPHRLLQNGIEILRANKLQEIDGEKFFWYFDTKNSCLYVYSKTEPNKISVPMSGKVIFIYNSSNINLQDIEIIGGNDSSLAIINSSKIVINSLKLGKYSRNGIKISDSTYVDISNSNIDANFIFDYSDAATYLGSSDRGPSNGIQISGEVSYMNIFHTLFKNWNHASIDINADLSNSKSDIHNIIIHDNFMTSKDIEYGGRLAIDGNAHHCEIYNNLFKDISVGNQINGHDNHFYHNIINGVKNSKLKTSKIGKGIALEGYAGHVYNNIIEKNFIENTESEGIYLARINKYTINNNNIRNNILYNCGTLLNGISLVIGRWNAGDGTTYNNNINNNIIYETNSTETKNLIIHNGVELSVGNFNNKFHNTAQASGNLYINPLFKN